MDCFIEYFLLFRCYTFPSTARPYGARPRPQDLARRNNTVGRIGTRQDAAIYSGHVFEILHPKVRLCPSKTITTTRVKVHFNSAYEHFARVRTLLRRKAGEVISDDK
jgi:hypothetical protein